MLRGRAGNAMSIRPRAGTRLSRMCRCAAAMHFGRRPNGYL